MTSVMERICHHCRRPIIGGRPRDYHDARCYQRAYRRRQAGLPEDAFPDAEHGARRGRISLAASWARREHELEKEKKLLRMKNELWRAKVLVGGVG
jgi:hypothetical protein